ncbi:anti-sigma factor antagonist [uncultured Jatrophihabitans sp.]|uniref:anti-sigma factor antagonist n=1 Tax=uncultured Jatrophihabitans sp. TaxID=1610747 RepID=UPI0035C9C72E
MTETIAKGVFRVDLTGEFDLANAHLISELVAPAFAGSTNHLVIDCGDVSFVDSTALAALVATQARAQQVGLTMALANVAPRIRRVLEIAHLDGVLQVEESVAGPPVEQLQDAQEQIARLERQVDGLGRALLNRDVIGQAKGVLMATRKLSAEEAFGLLAQISQRTNRKLTDIAAEVALTGSLPEPPRANGGR